MLRRGPNGGNLLIRIGERFSPAGHFQCLADPLGDRHMPRARRALHFAVLGILKYDLQTLSHVMSVSYSSP